MKIFCLSIYNQNYDLFKKNNLIPVGLGNQKFDMKWLNDKDGLNISNKNINFGEYTFHYNLWKNNKIKINNEDWFGFCTYRRFWVKKNCSTPKNLNELDSIILQEPPMEWKDYDTILAEPIHLGKQKFMKLIKNNFDYLLKKPSLLFKKCSIKDHFIMNHGSYFLNQAIDLLDEDEKEDFVKFLNKNEFNPHNLFICKKESLINAYYEKIFDWLFKCEKKFKNLKLNSFGERRIYGFLAERYLPFWFKKYSKTLDWPYIFFDTSKYRK
tara:strand:+ start:3000 stop:3803 length:804 start_codon:yes stop_codon:yes gene_type:complete